MLDRRALPLGAAALLVLGCASAVAQAAPAADSAVEVARRGAASWCVPGATVPVAAGSGFAVAACAEEGLTVTNGPAAVRLPDRGWAVSAHVLTTRGATSLSVARDAGGTVRITVPSQQRQGAVSAACSSRGYALLGYRIAGTYAWSYNPGGAPAPVALVAARTLTAATGAITSGRNDCGLLTKPRTAHRYLGPTAAAPEVSAASQCLGNDGRSVTGWKPLSAQVLAVTCTYHTPSTRIVAASDAAINSRQGWSVSARSCRNAYDLKGVMVHERGHTFGLAHTDAGSGLTMHPSIRTCDFSRRTLGMGDVLGLVRIYGAA